MMNVSEINIQEWNGLLQSPKRIALVLFTVITVVGGLMIDQIFFNPDRLTSTQFINLPEQHVIEQSNDAPLVSATETLVPIVQTPASTPTWKTLSIVKGSTLGTLLKSNGINTTDIAAVTSLPAVKKDMTRLKAGQKIEILSNGSDALLGMRYKISERQTINVVSKQEHVFIANIISQPITKHKVSVHGTVRGSLSKSVARAGVPKKIANELANIFSSKMNPSKDLHNGDRFNIVYEDEYVGSKKIGTTGIVAAKLETRKETYSAVRFVDAQGRTNYYTPEGKSLKSGFLRTPVHYNRIASSFSPGRVHPILHIRRPHYGVDLSAPRGTPIDAAGDGIVKFVGRDSGYGNLVIIDHGHGITTRYGHIQKFAKGLRAGQHVSEGQLIAYVGSTGLATGPHLHYEYRINGVPHDPLRVKLPGGAPIKPAYKKQFLKTAHELMVELETTDENAFASTHTTDNKA